MTDTRRLTPEEWAIARRRWEGCEMPGFDWLTRELLGAFPVSVSRQGVADQARRKEWKKGGEPSLPLADLAQDKAKLAHGLAQVQGRAIKKVAAEPMDLKPGEKPVGYAGTGRPSLYRPEYDAMIVAYFDKEPYTDHMVDQANGVVKLQRMPTDPPMLVGFAKSIGVSVDAVTRWAKETGINGSLRYGSFASAFAHARELQASMLARGAALGMYESRFLPFLMKNVHGWQDQPAKDVAATPVSAEELDRLYGQRMKAAYDKKMAVRAERAHLLGDS